MGWRRSLIRRQPFYVFQQIFQMCPSHLKCLACFIILLSTLITFRNTAQDYSSPIKDEINARTDDPNTSKSTPEMDAANMSRIYVGSLKRIISCDDEIGDVVTPESSVMKLVSLKPNKMTSEYVGLKNNKTLSEDQNGGSTFVDQDNDKNLFSDLDRVSLSHISSYDKGKNIPLNQSFGDGVRLASDVRLPAAIVAKGDPKPTPHRKNAVSESANMSIEETFYQDLLYGYRNDNECKEGHEVYKGAMDGSVMVISNGLDVEQATHRANEAYRSMFGDAAYNHQSMMSAIEVQLPSN
jgi:hypothetical protein